MVVGLEFYTLHVLCGYAGVARCLIKRVTGQQAKDIEREGGRERERARDKERERETEVER